MGKDKQRTKGGVKPSSSGRTAELLFKSQNVGFETPTAFSTYVPIITFGGGDFDGQDSKLSPEMRVVLRKLGKKDGTTKIKALGELTELFTQTPELCSDVLQYWPRIYSRLATDDSRKVRELCHGVLEIIGKQVGRNLALQLKSIFPYWFLSQSDIFAPASSTASNAFKNIFTTEKKQLEAVTFCREEILALIVDSLKDSSAPKKAGKEKKKESDSQQDGTKSAAGDAAVDSENYELRMIYASLVSLTKLVELNALEEDHLQSIFDASYFWTLTKHSSSAVRRQLFNLITTVANWKPSLIQRQCIKAITQSLREETSDCLQSLWNCFLTLTLNCEVFTTDPNLTKSQLLKVCKKGFYGNASSLGPAILPLVAKIGIDDVLVKELLQALQTGYVAEKSTLEKTAILRAYGEILAYYLSTASSSSSESIRDLLNEVAFPFLDTLIVIDGGSNTAKEFGRTIGTLIKKEEFFSLLSQWLTRESKETCEKTCGNFLASLCANNNDNTKKSGEQRTVIKRNVKFQLDADEPLESSSVIPYADLPAPKKSLVTNVAKFCLETASLDTFVVLSNYFKCEAFYNDVTDSNPTMITESKAMMSSSSSSSEDPNGTKLSLILDLIKTFPNLPAFLSKLSNLFENELFYKSIKGLKVFVNQIRSTTTMVTTIPSISRWLKQDLFCDRIKILVTDKDNLNNADALVIVKFILENHSLFGPDLLNSLTTAISSHLQGLQSADDKFLRDVFRLVSAMKGPVETIQSIVSILWERLLHFQLSVNNSINLSPEEQEARYEIDFLIQQLINSVKSLGLQHSDLYPAIQKAVDSAKSVREIDTLVELAKSVGSYDHENNQGFPLSPIFISSGVRFEKIKTEDLLSFLHLSHPTIISDQPAFPIYEQVKENLKISFLARSIFEAKLSMKNNIVEDITDFVNPVLKVLYAQAVIVFWREIEKFEMTKELPDDLANELNIVGSRWLEILAENKWTRWREELLDHLLVNNNNKVINRDPIFASKLPLKIFLKTARKMDLALSFIGRSKNLYDFIMEDSVSLANEENCCSVFLEPLLQNYFMGEQVHDLTPIIDYLNIQRKDFADQFQFDKIYAHLDGKTQQTLIFLVDLVINVMEKIVGDQQQQQQLQEEQQQIYEDKDDFISTATCWISAWLKQCKNLPTGSSSLKFYLLWVSKLARAVTLIAGHARVNTKFTTEYMEFHAANLYLPMYYLFLKLGGLNNKDFLTVRTMENVSLALSSIPSTTLAFVEPSPSKICANFVPYLEHSRLTVKILAYRLVKKVKPKAGEESDEVPIVPMELNEVIRKYGEELASRDIESLADDAVLTYLLSWDALLSMHADRSHNEFGSFSKEPHLLPKLLSILFFQLIDLIPENKFPTYFDTVPSIQPDNVPPNFGHLVCSVLVKALQCLPYPTRWWWNSQLSKQRDKIIVEKFIGRFLSSKLAAEELKRVQWNESDNVTVYSHPGCNELIAHYKIEDTTVSLTVTLPLNHPLGPINVKISDKKLLGKISHLLNNKSNSLAAGLQMWKENLDAKYAGHEECAICFFILHGPTKSLPKLACKTCNHKFHSACLLKWFNTSNKSECPLCRNLF